MAREVEFLRMLAGAGKPIIIILPLVCKHTDSDATWYVTSVYRAFTSYVYEQVQVRISRRIYNACK